ncbi:hypothetical protein AX15_001131 [Amanita polypyramis BW_CC]|nr:hypothetical protein AX15_001131 [Amanita polypyramis BW_CC]
MPYSPATIPEIFISPAPPEEPIAEPYSPFASIKYPNKDDGFRPRLLTPPPTSPLRTRPSSSPYSGGYNSDEERFDYNEGLDKQHFEALLQATRERNAKRTPSLLREVTLRAHQTKQIERRARFITRVLVGPLSSSAPGLLAPPNIPLTTPEAVASFHEPDVSASVSSSPNQRGEENSFDIWDKEASTPSGRSAARGNAVPSLEEIRARLTSQGYVCVPLAKRRTVPSQQMIATEYNTISSRQFSSSIAQLRSTDNIQIQAPQPLPSRCGSQLVPSADDVGPTRVSRAQDMLSALRRRTSPPIDPTERCNVDDKKRKRRSAPGDLFPLQDRVGFQHPVLSMPGGF